MRPAGAGRAQAALDVGPGEPARIGFVLDKVAEADQPTAAWLFFQPGQFVGDPGIGQVGPADYAGDGLDLQELLGLGRAVEHLDQDAGVDSAALAGLLEVGLVEAAPQGREVGQPVVPGRGRVPQVVVAIDDQMRAREPSKAGGTSRSR